MITDGDFYLAVGKTDFAGRYLELCRRFPIRNIATCNLNNKAISQLSSKLGMTVLYDSRDHSFSVDSAFGSGRLHLGFVIQQLALVEFWFWFETNNERIGSNFSVIAYEALKRASGRIPIGPPFQRPEYHSAHELQSIIRECMELSECLKITLKSLIR